MLGKRKWCIYKHTNIINGKIYIGITSLKLSDRWRSDGKGYKHCRCFYNAIQKYGWDNFTHEILESNLSKEEACKKEIEYIKHFNSQTPNGYNIDEGGSSGSECRKSIIAISKDKKTRYEFSSIVEASKFFNCCPSSISKALSRNGTCKNYVFVYKDDLESGKIQLEDILNSYISCKKCVYQYDFITHKYIDKYESLSEASVKTGTNRPDISNCLLGKTKSANGFIWSYCKITDFSIYKRKTTPSTKKVSVVKLSLSGEILKIYNTIGEAARDNNLFRSGISACLSGRNKTCGGYIWRYAD